MKAPAHRSRNTPLPSVPLSNELAQQALDLKAQYGNTKLASAASGVPAATLDSRIRVAMVRGMAPSEIQKPLPTGNGIRVLVIPDMHMPFHHPDTLEFLKAVKKRFQPTQTICLGDELDNHALSQYDPDPDGYSAGHELNAALESIQGVYREFPMMSVMESNHGVRGFKKAFRAGIPAAMMREYKEFMKAPQGWSWHPQMELDGVIYKHGDGYSGKDAALNAAKDNMKSTVIGHIHSFAGVQYYNNGDRQIWGMNCGCLADIKSYAMKYAQHARSKPIIACGVVDKGLPTLIAMRMNKERRWTGEL